MRETTLGIRNVEIACDHRNHRVLRQLSHRRRLVVTLRPAPDTLLSAAEIQVSIRHRLRNVVLGVLARDDADRWRPRILDAMRRGRAVRLPATVPPAPCPEIWAGEELS